METIRTLFSSKALAWLLVLIAAIAVPPIVGGYLTSMLILIGIWTIMCFSMNLIYGYTGQLSMAHSALAR
jgi:ABC-type branched-subunit amino acid transport system permease subunit